MLTQTNSNMVAAFALLMQNGEGPKHRHRYQHGKDTSSPVPAPNGELKHNPCLLGARISSLYASNSRLRMPELHAPWLPKSCNIFQSHNIALRDPTPLHLATYPKPYKALLKSQGCHLLNRLHRAAALEFLGGSEPSSTSKRFRV